MEATFSVCFLGPYKVSKIGYGLFSYALQPAKHPSTSFMGAILEEFLVMLYFLLQFFCQDRMLSDWLVPAHSTPFSSETCLTFYNAPPCTALCNTDQNCTSLYCSLLDSAVLNSTLLSNKKHLLSQNNISTSPATVTKVTTDWIPDISSCKYSKLEVWEYVACLILAEI